MFVDSWAAFYSIRKEREQGFDEKKAVRPVGPPLLVEAELEIKPQTELHAARRVCAREMQKIGGAQSRADGASTVAELRVIENVEILPAEIDAGLLADGEPLEDANVKVQAARQVEAIPADIAKCKAPRHGKCSGIVKERSKRARFLI